MAFDTAFTPRQFQACFDVIQGDASVNPGSAPAGGEVSGTVTITGAALGDHVLVAPGVDLQTCILSASVISANTVEWVLLNETADHIDLAASTWNFAVLSPKGIAQRGL